MALSSVRLLTARITISTSRQIIIHLLIRSRPFCRPKLHTRKPATTVMIIHRAISPGLACILVQTESTSAGVMPLKVPVANLTQ